MEQNGFNSDSTYCSLYETKRNVNNGRKVKALSANAVLKEIQYKVQLHFEGMKLGSTSCKIIAERIKESLHKIHKCNEYFEKSLINSGKYSQIISEQVEVCGVTQDIQMLEKNQIGFNTMTLPCANISESYSFGSDMLSNKMFLTTTSLTKPSDKCTIINDTLLNHYELKIENNKVMTDDFPKVCSMDLFPSQESSYSEKRSKPNYSQVSKSEPKTRIDECNKLSFEIPDSNGMNVNSNMSDMSQVTEMYIESFTPLSSLEQASFKVPTLPHKESKAIVDSSSQFSAFMAKNVKHDETTQSLEFNVGNSDTSNREQSVNSLISRDFKNGHGISTDTFKSDTELETTQSLIPVDVEDEIQTPLGSELVSVVSKIMKLNDECFQKVNFLTNSIPETLAKEKEVNFNTLKTMGSSFVKSYNKTIQKLHCDLGHKSWEEINEELEYTNKLSKETSDMLSDMLAKICLEESKTIKTNHSEKLKVANFHGFDQEDASELDMKNLLESNAVLLNQLSKYFESKLMSMREYNLEQSDCLVDYLEGSFRMIDWRELVKDAPTNSQ